MFYLPTPNIIIFPKRRKKSKGSYNSQKTQPLIRKMKLAKAPHHKRAINPAATSKYSALSNLALGYTREHYTPPLYSPGPSILRLTDRFESRGLLRLV